MKNRWRGFTDNELLEIVMALSLIQTETVQKNINILLVDELEREMKYRRGEI